MLKRNYPNTRLRRTRSHTWSRDLCAETNLTSKDLIYPLFVAENKDNKNNKKEPIKSMPGVFRHNIDSILSEVKIAHELGIPAIALFPQTPNNLKTIDAKEAINPDNLICNTVREIKKLNLDIGVICDVALDPYILHGHDGLIINGEINNDLTIEVLSEQALIQAQAGCDIIAPSDMQDGRVGAIRKTLENNNFHNTLILSYAAKYASSFYGPFRDAVGSKDNLNSNIDSNIPKDKKTYQQDYANSDEALHEVALDLQEGADMIMVKPGMPYLDIIHRVKIEFKVPTFAYQVSGEYAMLKFVAENTDMDFINIMLESLTSFKRAGCDGILTYAACDIAKVL